MPRSLDLIPPGSRGSDPYLVTERGRGPSPRPRVGSGARCNIKVAFVCSVVKISPSGREVLPCE